MLIRVLTHIKDVVTGNTTLFKPRSSKWEGLRTTFLIQHPKCVVCGNTKYLEVHHIKPFKNFPELELDPKNLITLCEKGTLNGKTINCHLHIGHDGNFKFYNDTLIAEIQEINIYKNSAFDILGYLKERHDIRATKSK